MKTEKAIFLTPLQLSGIKKIPGKISKVYLGSDSCEHMLPSPEDIKKVHDMGVEPVVSVPILTDFHLERLCGLVPAMLKLYWKPEVSANDIGTVIRLRKKFGSDINISAGRHLFAQWARNSLDYTARLRDEFNISMFETDDVYTAESFLQTNKFRIAFHYPYKYYSLTRICPYKGGIYQNCDRDCADRYIPLDDGSIIWRGNAYFTKSGALPGLPPDRMILSYDMISGHVSKGDTGGIK
ncbi:MAG: hypothetical protein J6Z08_01520 [Elusimicrobiales bacterium]|nr:hypothetical protein [Elusimicrobiales bacterium]